MTKRTFVIGTNNFQFRLNKQDKTNTDELMLFLPASTSIAINDEVEMQLADSTIFFLGLVQELQINNGKKTAKVWDYGSELLQRNVNDIYTSMSPEAIIEDVINNYTSLTYVSTISSGITIGYYVANKKRAWDVVTELTELLLANFYVDSSKNFQLELEGDTTITSLSISTDTAILEGGWKTDATQIINSVTVDGDDRQIFERDPELFNGDNSTTEFTLAEIPVSIKVEHPLGTILTGYTPSVSTGDYYIERENKKIIFDTAPSTGTGNIKATYNVSVPISVLRRNAESITNYGLREKVFKKSYITTRTEARKYAEYIITRYKDPIEEVTFILPTSQTSNINSYLPNAYISVTDDVNNKSGNYIIREINWEYPGNFRLKVGTPIEDIIYWQKEIQQKVKQLEEKDDNTTIINVDELIEENVQIQLTTTVTIQTRTLPDNYLYLGDANDSPVYTNIGDGTERPLKDATGGVQDEYLITDKTTWDSSWS